MFGPSILVRSYICDTKEMQYVKQETQTIGPNGKEARAIRLITERASRRIGEMAFKIASGRERKVRTTLIFSISAHKDSLVGDDHPQIERLISDGWSLPRNDSTDSYQEWG